MTYLEKFKLKIGQWVFHRELTNNKRLKSVCNLDNAKSIGILYDATNEYQIKQIQPFISYFFEDVNAPFSDKSIVLGLE